jgi:hypothetical protein
MKAFNQRRKGTKISRTESLECKPIKSVHVAEMIMESGDVLLTYPVRIRPWLAGLIRYFGGAVGKPFEKKLQLDKLGTQVWELMDGKRSVRQVIQGFAGKHQLHYKEAEVAVSLFLRDLGKRGLIGLK